MVETISLWDRARSLGGKFFGGNDASPESDGVGAFAGTAHETREMFDIIEARLQEARDVAQARGDRPTLEDYRQACERFGETEQGKALATPDALHPNGRWTPSAYANLAGQVGQGSSARGHDLSGFAISEPQKRAMTDVMNLDSDGAINDFYTNIDFTGANLNNAYVDPATSFNEEIARAKNLDGLTFNNMSANDPAFVFGAGNYSNIHMTNINGGEIIFGDNSRVTGLDIQGTSATVTMGDYAKVSDVKPIGGFSMMNLSMGDGSLLSNANLTNATISQASEFGNGATFQNVTLGTNISGVDFSGVTFNNVTFNGSNLSDTSFAGATLNGVVFNNVDMNTLDLSGAKSLDGVKVNNKPIASANDLQMMQLAGGVTIPSWNPDLNNAPSPAPATQMVQFIAPLAERDGKNSIGNSVDAQTIVNVNAVNNPNDIIAAIRASTAATAITFGGDANFNTVTQTAAVTSQPRTIDPNDVPNLGSGNMNVGNA